MRLFFAVALPSSVRSALARLQTTDAAYRWVDAEQLHVTLAFLGEQPESRFGPRSAPRVLWIGLAGDLSALLHLASALTERLRDAGFPVEDRPLQPHITLARRRERGPGGSPVPWPPPEAPTSATIPLDQLILFQSRLSPRGATYVPLGQFPLRPR